MVAQDTSNLSVPIILYDIDSNKVPFVYSPKTRCFFIRNIANFSITIIEGNVIVYKATSANNVEHSSIGFSGANSYCCYTLYFNDYNPVTIQCQTLIGQEHIVNYTFTLREQEQPDHYTDIIINNELPTYAELEPAILVDDEKFDLVKRLLLDFKYILRHKGTKRGITNFLNFIGLANENLTVYDEYKHINADGTTTPTISPNTAFDEKTGNYHMLFDNYEFSGYDANNLPINNIIIHDLKTFFQKLVYAIALANTYFTSKEQDITFFGLNYSSNAPMFPSITSNMSCIIKEDIHFFEKNISIDMLNYSKSDKFKYVVNQNQQAKNVDTNVYKSEIKIFKQDNNIFGNKEIFFIDEEIFDDTVITDPVKLKKIQSIFAVCQHLKITSPNTYVEVTIRNKVNVLSELKYSKALVKDSLNLIFVSTLNGGYIVTVDIYDQHNNRERYNFTYFVSANVANIDFETFNSAVVINSNKLTTDVESPSNTLTVTAENQQNFILDSNYIPDDLSQYYMMGGSDGLKYLTNNKRYIVPRINKNYVVNAVTDTIPLKFVENYLVVVTFKYDPNKILKLQIVNPNTNRVELIDYNQIGSYYKALDKIFVNVMDINMVVDGVEVTEPYIFVTTTESGLDLLKIWNFAYVHNTTGAVELIENIKHEYAEIPVNYDFPLFIRPSLLVPTFASYISPNAYNNIIQSLFTRIVNIDENTTGKQTYYLKLGDIVGCKINEKLIANNNNLVWRVYNSFTKEKLFETNDYMLKYRIDDNICFDVECEFIISESKHSIYKASLFSSFDIQL